MIPAIEDRLEKLLQDFTTCGIMFDLTYETGKIAVVINGIAPRPAQRGVRKRFAVGEMDDMLEFMHTEALRIYPRSDYAAWAKKTAKEPA